MHRAKTYMWHTYLPRPVEALVFDTLQWVVIRGSTNDLYGHTILRTCCTKHPRQRDQSPPYPSLLPASLLVFYKKKYFFIFFFNFFNFVIFYFFEFV